MKQIISNNDLDSRLLISQKIVEFDLLTTTVTKTTNVPCGLSGNQIIIAAAISYNDDYYYLGGDGVQIELAINNANRTLLTLYCVNKASIKPTTTRHLKFQIVYFTVVS